MKVLLTATVHSHICQFHKPLVEMLRESGEVEIHVASNNNLHEKNGMKLDFVDKVYNVPFSRSPKSPSNIKAYKIIKKIIDEGNYDVIHCNTPVGGVITRLAARDARKKGVKVFYTVHGFHFYEGASFLNWMIFYPIEKLLSRITDKLITINEKDYLLAKKRFRCECKRIHGVGVDVKRYFPVDSKGKKDIKKKLGLSMDKRYILCVGELLPNKNQQMAINAIREVVREIPNTVLLIAGNGPDKEQYEEHVLQYDLEENVIFLDYVTNLEEYQRVCDVSISCSYREGLGMNVIEAMLTGNPVIATINRGHSELIQDSHNGFLVEPGNSVMLAEKIKEVLFSEEKRRAMGSYALETGKAYSQEVVKRELESIYLE